MNKKTLKSLSNSISRIFTLTYYLWGSLFLFLYKIRRNTCARFEAYKKNDKSTRKNIEYYGSRVNQTAKILPTSAITPTGTSTEVGITEGQLSVSLTGGGSYSIPSAVPSGISEVVPQVILTYNSQGGILL